MTDPQLPRHHRGRLYLNLSCKTGKRRRLSDPSASKRAAIVLPGNNSNFRNGRPGMIYVRPHQHPPPSKSSREM